MSSECLSLRLMLRKVRLCVIAVIILALSCGSLRAQSSGTSPENGQSTAVHSGWALLGPPQPVPLAHLYWHFLMYQRHLDLKAAELEAAGKPADVLRNYLQLKAGLSNSDYQVIRNSSGHLAKQINDLNTQAKSILAAGKTPATHTQLAGLSTQREGYINAEVANIRQSLAPSSVSTFESFLTSYFSLNNAAPRSLITHSASSGGTK